jgi:hypothetical protein
LLVCYFTSTQILNQCEMLQEMLETLEERLTTNYRECVCAFFSQRGERQRALNGCVKKNLLIFLFWSLALPFWSVNYLMGFLYMLISLG